ncbi:MAG: T9SS C-terminal target domain-containing protein [Cytophagales bacterium]|nr:MAG: T9SS C-terminal target domain-containing protein [Cytophagales bacterium]
MKHKTIFFLLLLMTLSRLAFGQLFMQNFSSSTDLASGSSPYISPNAAPATPQTGQFTWLNTTASTSVDINAGMLRFQRGNNGGGYLGRNTSLSNPTSLIISFDISVSNTSGASTTTAASLRIGDSFNNNNSSEPNTSVYARLGINILATSGEFQVRDIGASANSATFSGQQKVIMILNKTGAALNYAAPNGTLSTVANNKMDVWVGAISAFDEIDVLTTTVNMNHFKFIYDDRDNSSISLDNFYINTVGGALSSGNYTLGTNGDFQSITNAGGVFNVLNNLGSVATGGYNFQVAADLTAETGVNPLNQISGMSSGNLVRITAASNSRVISGSVSGSVTSLINFNGADFVSIDGGNGGTITGANRMTITNVTNTGQLIQFVNDAQNHTITDCILSGRGNSNNGLVFIAGTTGLNGNDNITIQKCIIQRSNAALRRGVVCTGLSAAITNDNITIQNNDLIDIHEAGNNNIMYAVFTNATNLKVNSNNFYQTANILNTATGATYALFIQIGTNCTGVEIKDNNMGGQAANCGGSPYVFNAITGGITENPIRLYGIRLRDTSINNVSIENNTIANISMAFRRVTGTSANESSFRAIYVTSGTNLSIKNNTIGSLTTNSLSFSNIADATVEAIPIDFIHYNTAGANCAIEGNKLGGAACNLTATNTSLGFAISGIIATNSTAGLSVKSNTIGGTNANSINVNYAVTNLASTNSIVGIITNSTGLNSLTIDGNTLQNFTCNSTSTATAVRGIYQTGSASTEIKNNIISNFTSLSTAPPTPAGTGDLVAVSGISINSSTNTSIKSNTIHTLISSQAASTGTTVAGMLLTGSVNGKIEINQIYNLRNTSAGTTPAAAGIITRDLGSMSIINNMISLGLNTDGTPNVGDAMYIGLWNNFNDLTKITFIYNSIAISGSITNGTKNSYGLLRGDNAGTSISTPVEVINNLFYNERQELGAGSKHFAIGNQVTCNNWGGGCSGIASPCTPTSGGAFLPNYNAFYSANASTIGEWLGASQTFANWQTATQADDKSTVLAASMTFTDLKTGNLHIPNTEFRLNAIALPLYLSPTIILTDYDGDFRRGADIGADEVENTVTFTGVTDDWNNMSNWTPNIVPTCADIAVVPTGKSIKIYASTVAQCYKLLIQSGGQLTLENNTSVLEQCWLNGSVSGFSHNGDVAINASGTLTMNDGKLRVAGNLVQNGNFEKGTGTTELNFDLPTGNICITNHIKSYNVGLNTSDINSSLLTNFHNLTILNSGQTTIAKDVTVGDATTKLGVFDITDGSTFIVNGNKLTLESTLAERTGTITGSTTSKLHILGKGDLIGTLKFTSGGTEDFQEVVMNRIDDGAVKGLAALGNASLQINDFLDLTAGILKTGTIADCSSGGAANLEISITNNNLSNSVKNYNAAGYASTGGWVWGNLRRAITGTGLYSFPVGDGTRYQLFNLDIKNTLVGTSNIVGYFNQCDAPNGTWTANDVRGSVTFVYNNVCIGGYWRMTPDNSPSGLYDAEIFPVNILCSHPAKTIGKSAEGAGVYAFGGSTHVSDTKRTGYTSFSDFSLITTNVFLPVEVISFTATTQKSNALISWETIREKDNDYFEIQKSIDGKNFMTIGIVRGNGTSVSKHSYQFIDSEPHKGVNYYRLKQIDLDGKINYSRMISLYFDNGGEIFSIAPNPTNQLNINITISAKIGNELNIKVIDGLGRSIFAENHVYQAQVIPLKSNETVAKGIYFVVVHNLTTGKVHTKKLIIE